MSLFQLYLIWTWNWVSTDKQLLVVAVLSAPLLVSLCLAAPLPSSAAAFKCAPVSVTGGHPAASEPRDGLTAAMFCPRRTSAATEVSLSKRLPSCFVSPFFTASSHQCFFFFKHAMQLLQWREAVKWCTWRHHQTAIKSHCAPQVCAVMLQEMETCYTPADSHCMQYTNWSAPSYVIIFVVVLSQWLSQSPPAASPTPRYLWQPSSCSLLLMGCTKSTLHLWSWK